MKTATREIQTGAQQKQITGEDKHFITRHTVKESRNRWKGQNYSVKERLEQLECTRMGKYHSWSAKDLCVGFFPAVVDSSLILNGSSKGSYEGWHSKVLSSYLLTADCSHPVISGDCKPPVAQQNWAGVHKVHPCEMNWNRRKPIRMKHR